MPAQQAKPTEPSQTKIELFQAKTGSVLIKNFSEIGSLRGLGGTATVTSWEFIDAQTGKKAYGLSVEVKESSRLEREERAFIDYDEIDSLLKGLDYINTIDKSITKLKNFQADYRTTGDLRVSSFSGTSDAEYSVAVGRVGRVSVFYKADAFAAFRKLIVDAKAALDAIKPA
jgi:hypothetical protein